MVTVNGKEFNSLDDAQEYMNFLKQEEKEKESKEEQKRRVVEGFVSGKLYSKVVASEAGDWLFCVISDDASKAKRLVDGKIEECLGVRHSWNMLSWDYDVKYVVGSIRETSDELKSLVVDKLMSEDYLIEEGRVKALWRNENVDDTKYIGIVLESFIELPIELVFDERDFENEKDLFYDFLSMVGFQLR